MYNDFNSRLFPPTSLLDIYPVGTLFEPFELLGPFPSLFQRPVSPQSNPNKRPRSLQTTPTTQPNKKQKRTLTQNTITTQNPLPKPLTFVDAITHFNNLDLESINPTDTSPPSNETLSTLAYSFQSIALQIAELPTQTSTNLKKLCISCSCLALLFNELKQYNFALDYANLGIDNLYKSNTPKLLGYIKIRLFFHKAKALCNLKKYPEAHQVLRVAFKIQTSGSFYQYYTEFHIPQLQTKLNNNSTSSQNRSSLPQHLLTPLSKQDLFKTATSQFRKLTLETCQTNTSPPPPTKEALSQLIQSFQSIVPQIKYYLESHNAIKRSLKSLCISYSCLTLLLNKLKQHNIALNYANLGINILNSEDFLDIPSSVKIRLFFNQAKALFKLQQYPETRSALEKAKQINIGKNFGPFYKGFRGKGGEILKLEKALNLMLPSHTLYTPQTTLPSTKNLFPSNLITTQSINEKQTQHPQPTHQFKYLSLESNYTSTPPTIDLTNEDSSTPQSHSLSLPLNTNVCSPFSSSVNPNGPLDL